jgi:ribosomal-protein-alanine N-acetyltransferase
MIRRILSMPGAFGLASVTAARKTLVGFALGRVVVDECELLSIAVAPAWRGRGIGAQLLDAAISWASACDAKKLFLEVAEGNASALRLYQRRGLVQVGRRPDYYELKSGALVDALTMRCDLVASARGAARRRPSRRTAQFFRIVRRITAPPASTGSSDRTSWPSSAIEAGTFSTGSCPLSKISATSPDDIFSIKRRVFTNVIGQTSPVISRQYCGGDFMKWRLFFAD